MQQVNIHHILCKRDSCCLQKMVLSWSRHAAFVDFEDCSQLWFLLPQYSNEEVNAAGDRLSFASLLVSFQLPGVIGEAMNILETRVLGCPLRNAQVLARTALLRRALNWPDSITAVLLRLYENIITRDRVDQQLGSLSAYREWLRWLWRTHLLRPNRGGCSDRSAHSGRGRGAHSDSGGSLTDMPF
ncbi:hypothetical protein Q3G72_027902 [Acer saccharum]|nr:hypothetical protein Q3G72_027902 [Acer saccharum]